MGLSLRTSIATALSGPNAARAALVEISRLECEGSLAEFVKQAWHVVQPGRELVWNWHLEALCQHLEAVTDGRVTRLLVNVPFRTGKSLITGVFWPAWDWIKKRERQWLCTSYAQRLATRDALRTRRLIQSPWYQARWAKVFRLAGDQNEKSRYENNRGGYRLSAGFTGGVMGDGCDILLIDDPHDRAGAHSETERPRDLLTYDEALTTRLNDPKNAAIVIIMQRLHEQDLAGHVLAREGKDWVHLMLPMEYEPERACVTRIGFKDPRKKPGELLCPERVGPVELARMKVNLGSYGAAGQLQQRPSPQGGGIIKKNWWQMWPKGKQLPPALHIFNSVDTAFTDKDLKDAAFSAYTTWMIFEDEFTGRHALMLLGAWWEQVGYPDLKKKISASHKKNDLDYTVIEKKASGISLLQDLKKQRKPRLNVRGFNPGKLDKVSRVHLASPMFEAGLVYYPEGKEWATKVIDFVAVFPAGASPSKDVTDTVSQAVLYVKKRMWMQPPEDDDPPSKPDTRTEEELEDDEPIRRKRSEAAYG